MKNTVFDQKEIYHEINGVTGCVNSVIFGTQSLSELPVAELVQDFGLNISVCNRSVEEAVLADAFDLLDECVYELNPHKVFLNFGETDLRRDNFNMEAFISDYKRLIAAIQDGCKCSVFVVSVLSESREAEALNIELQKICRMMNVRFVDASGIFAHEKPRLRLFSELMHYMREGRISFTEAMHFCDA